MTTASTRCRFRMAAASSAARKRAAGSCTFQPSFAFGLSHEKRAPIDSAALILSSMEVRRRRANSSSRDRVAQALRRGWRVRAMGWTARMGDCSQRTPTKIAVDAVDANGTDRSPDSRRVTPRLLLLVSPRVEGQRGRLIGMGAGYPQPRRGTHRLQKAGSRPGRGSGPPVAGRLPRA